MPISEIEEFAKTLIERARDAAIESNDRTLHEGHVVARRWKNAATTGSPEAFAKVLIPDIVDDTIFYILQAIDDGTLKLSFTASNGKVVDLTAQGRGELAGWYMGSPGWRAKYAKERFADDFSDLKGSV
jgi:hypothetical protein